MDNKICNYVKLMTVGRACVKIKKQFVSAKRGKSILNVGDRVGVPPEEGGGLSVKDPWTPRARRPKREITYGLQHIEKPSSRTVFFFYWWHSGAATIRKLLRSQLKNILKTEYD